MKLLRPKLAVIKSGSNGSPSSPPRVSPATRNLDSLPVRKPGGHLHRSFVFYGRSGTGKTTVACSFPGRKLLLDVRDVGDDSVGDVEDLDVMDVRTWDDFEMAYWFIKKNPDKYQVLIVDTLSQLQQLAIQKILDDKGKDEEAGAWGSMTKQEWGQTASLLKAWIIHLRDLPMQVALIAQDRTFNVGEEDAAEGLDPEVGPGLMPSVAKTLNAAVHAVLNTFIRRRVVRVKRSKPEPGKPPFREEERFEFCVRVGPNPTYITKIRKAKTISVPQLIVDPTYDKIVEIIEGRGPQTKRDDK